MQFQKSQFRLFLSTLLLASLVGMGLVASTSVPPAAAQDARAMVSPTSSTATVGEIITVDVYLENVDSLWAGQISLSFDPAVVQVVDEEGNPATRIQRGDLMNPARVTEFVNAVDNSAGIIEYAASLRNDPRRPVPPASGTGSLAQILFKGLGAGTSAVAFSTEATTYVHEIKFVDGDLNAFTLPLEDGSVSVTAGEELYLPLIRRSSAAQSVTGSVSDIPVVAGMPRMYEAVGASARRRYGVTAPLDDPERLGTGSVFDIAVGGGYAFWTEQQAELCGPGIGEGQVRKVNLTTLSVTTLRRGCSINPANVAADDSHVYYIDRVSDTIERIPVGGGSASTVGTGSSLESTLALDSTHVYFADAEGLKRVPKAGGTVDTLAAGYSVWKLAVDDSHVYWTERRPPASDHAIRRVLKEGGSTDTLLSGGDLLLPWGIAVDSTHVYWTEGMDSGRVRRMPKDGGTPDDLEDPDPPYFSRHIAVDGTNAYWLDSSGGQFGGRLRRVPRGGGTVENLALGIGAPSGLDLTTEYVYWGDGSGVWRLPIGASEVRVDLTIADMEITQGIQNLANDVPLVAGKTTYVRVYPEVDTVDTAGVTAQLRGFRGGTELAGSPLRPRAPSGYVRTSGADRAVLSHTFNFWIPPAWRSGTVEFRAEINPTGAIPESNTGNNTFSVTRTFNHRNPLCVDMVRVHTHPRTASIDDPGFWDIVDWMRAAFPIPDVWVYEGEMIDEVSRGSPQYEMPDDSNKVLARLWWYDVWHDDPSECDNKIHYFGMVHQSHLYMGGAGARPGTRAWGAMNTDPAFLDGTWPWYVPHGGASLAHEVGHNLGRRHVDCGGPEGIDSDYPYGTRPNQCDIGPDDPTAYYGFDVLDVAVIPPTTAGDLMSYSMSEGKPRWPSDYTYRALYEEVPRAAAQSSAAPTALAEEVAQAAEVLAVSGLVTPTLGTATLDYAYRLPEGLVSDSKLTKLASETLTSQPAPYSLQLLDAADAVLREQSFDLLDDGDPIGDMRSFTLLMPYDPQTAAIAVSQGGTELVRRAVSPSPPSVQVLSPNGGENIAGSMTIQWTATDPDEDTLLYTVQYSPDAGTTWQILATDHFSPTLTVDNLRSIPGSDTALVRVIASDGVNTANDVSDQTFSVAFNAPSAYISRPADGAVFAPGTQIILIGGAFDAEDGTLPDDALQWFLDGDPLGLGKEIALSGLDPGTYVVMLRATDSGQMTDEEEITIHVQQLLCEAADNVDLVFLLDTSPNMEEYLDSACEAIPDVVNGLRAQGLKVRHSVMGTTQQKACATASVRDKFPTSSVNSPADWGPGVMDVAGHYGWQEGSTRFVVPITNQGPEDGDPVEDPGADRDAVDAAIAAAQLNQVTAAPLLMPSPGLDVYFADAGESPGSVYSYDTATDTEDTLYTRPSERLYSFTTYHLPSKLYYVNANDNKIYRTAALGGGWGPEEVVYEHTTFIRDLAFVEEAGGLALYFSEASGADADGRIYKLEGDEPALYYEVKLEDVNGFWAGDFTFDDEMTLYLSSGNRVPARIFRVDGASVVEIYKDEAEPIAGLTYMGGALYYANWRTAIYRLGLHSGERTVVYSNPQRTWLSDVGVIRQAQAGVPATLELAEALANATGGRVFQWGDPDLDVSGELGRTMSTVTCAPAISGVSPVCGIDEETTLTLFGENLAVGTQLSVGGTLAREVTPSEDGTQMTFKIPLGLDTGRTYDLYVEQPGVGSDTLPGGLTVGPCSDRCDGFMPGDIHAPMWDLWDEEMEFQALAASSSLTLRLYARGGGMELSVEDIGGTPLASTPVADGATGTLNVPTTPGTTYVIRVRARQEGMVHFRLLSWGANWLRIPDDGDDWSGGVNAGSGENHGAESNAELGFEKRWTDVGPQFATTTWYFNVLDGTERLAVRVWGESPYGDGHGGMEWVNPNGVVIPLVGPEGPTFDHTWTVASPTSGFWGLRLIADPPFSPWAQHYSLARVDDSDDDWLYLRTGTLAGAPCGPSVTLDPPEGNICLDDIFQMDIIISDVANLYGAEVYLTFDPAMLEVVDENGDPAFEIEPGPFLDPTQGLVGLNSADNVGGFIDYAVSLKDPAESAFGTGVLATAYFRGKGTGTTTVQFDEVKLSERPVPPAPGTPIAAEFRDATFEVNECFAPGEVRGAFSGQVVLDGRLNHSGGEVTAEPGEHLVLTLPDGGFELPALAAGDYTVDVEKRSYLRAGDRTFTVASSGSVALPSVTLLGGDCNNDDTIEIEDGSIATAAFGLSIGQAGFDPRADINGDGVVDIFDLVMVGNNWGCSVTDTTARCQRWNRP